MQLNNDEGNLGIITEERIRENQEQVIQKVYQVLDKLEKRIATLEKALQSHAKCIGNLNHVVDAEIELNPNLRKKIVKRIGELHE